MITLCVASILYISQKNYCLFFFLGSDVVPLPVNFQRLIWNAKTIFRVSDNQVSDLHPNDIIMAVKELSEKLHVIKGDDPITVDVKNSATQLWKSVRNDLYCIVLCVIGYSMLMFRSLVSLLTSWFSFCVHPCRRVWCWKSIA